VGVPGVAGRLVLAERAAQIFQDAQIVERVDVAGDDQRQRLDVSGIGWIGGEKRRLGAGTVEIGDDCEALSQSDAVNLEHRHQALRVAGSVVRLLLSAGGKVHRDAVMIDSLEVERDPDPIARGGAEIIEQQGLGHIITIPITAAVR
jgi:hypothetical protein